ncbi:ABC transporter ATP-binding protein [Actinoplanes friuliensis]|uniref:Acetoin ABC transporter ATP-binding protein YtrE n=1 Tax=Actinoplanes friuliensis DSM 7358 TaxID=1246995 RepID=U5VS18_9ACTN|nr:ATP-binding cassette domain-containing protein [Actinoplanes friuliensis]AGZ39634.1 acetoin ABC transporter ATP-binding protein YtrE [Actinoplanes friuliensis DSM 7358]
MTGALVEVRAVSHTRGSGASATQVLQDVDLSLPPATLAVLAGRSGSGKSTLCHLVAGVMAPGAGQVLVDGRAAYPAADWATVSLLPQRLALEPELTVAENVLLPAGVRGRSPAADLLERLGLAAIAGRPARDTSLGEQQRAALARALVLNPAVAVLDEPTAHQDDDHVRLILEVLAASVTAGTLALVATHDQRVIDVAGVVVRLRSGRVLPAA